MNKLLEIVQLAGAHPDGQVIFSEPLVIKSSPHWHLFTAYGVWSGPNGLYVLDGAGDWHGPVEENQGNAEFMINSIYQRLKVLPVPSVIVANYDQEVNAVIFE